MNLNYPILYYSSLLKIIEGLHTTFNSVKNLFQCYFPHRFEKQFTADFLNKCALLNIDHLSVDKAAYQKMCEAEWDQFVKNFQQEVNGITPDNWNILLNTIHQNYWCSYVNSINLDELNLLYSQCAHYYHKAHGDYQDDASLDLLESDISRALVSLNNDFNSLLSAIKKNYSTFITQHFFIN